MKYIIAILLLTFPSSSLACSCVPQAIKESFDSAEEVFSGFVVKITNYEEPYVEYKAANEDNDIFQYRKITIEVGETFKGSQRKNKRVIITANQEGACGYSFEIERKILVFANKFDDDFNEATLCNNTQKLAFAEDQVLELRELEKQFTRDLFQAEK